MNLVGTSCETTLCIEGVDTTVLLDTGATVSTVVKSYYEKHFSHLPIIELNNILNVEVAGGHLLNYAGYIQVSIIPRVLNIDKSISGLLLVVDDTSYGHQVPVILGTNILSQLNHIRGKREIPTVWHTTFRTMTLTARRFRRNKGQVALLHCSQPVTIPPNGTAILDCYPDNVIQYKGAVVIEPIVNERIPNEIEVLPTLMFHQFAGDSIPVQVANHMSHPFTFQSRALCAKLEAATVMPVTSTVPIDNEFCFNFDFSSSGLSEQEVETANKLLTKWANVFSRSETDVGFTDAVHHRIELLDETPFKQRYRRIPPAMIKEVKEHLQQLYDAGIIQPSQSPFASNLVLARKKDGRLRLCIDFRQLNRTTKKDAYALPRITEIFDYLSGAKYFSVLDMKSGYHQVPIHCDDMYKTAFTAGPLGHWEFRRLAFGLTNSPATYQRLMENVFSGLYLDFVQVYLDDIIVFSNSFQEHTRHLEALFQRLAEYNLKLAPQKCKLFQKSVKYLGHIVSADGVSVDPEKTDKVSSWPVPSNANDLHRFMGFANYYRRYIDGFAKIAQPLTKLLRGTNCTKKSRKTTSPDWVWQVEQQQAFDKLKHCLTHAPILSFADGSLPYELHIDGSRQALGAVLYQKQNGVNKVIAYGSRTLSPTESNYPAHKLEFLALKWAVTEKFHDYLYGANFTVYTDNNPLTYVLTSAKLDATGHRWLAALAAYQFDIKFRSGRRNGDADALSRLSTETNDIKQNVVSSICQVQQLQPWYTSLCVQSPLEDNAMEELPLPFNSASFSGWKEVQRRDSEIGPLFPFVAQKSPPDRNQLPLEARPLVRYFDKLSIVSGALYRTVLINDESVRQIVLPVTFRREVLQILHDRMGHMGRDRTMHLLKERFFWPGMTKDVDLYISRCRRCIQRKKPDSKAPLVPITTTQPLEIVSLDHLTLEPSKGGFQHILVMTDLFTRYAVAIPVRNLSASATAKALVDNFVVHYGIPQRIHSDQGGAFESRLIGELCKLLGISKSRTTAYHPEGNGVTERFNRSLLGMLGTLEPKDKLDWKSQIAPLVHAYNCTPHSATSYSPYFLMFGRHPNLPIDVAMGITRSSSGSTQPHHYVAELRSRLLRAYMSARKASDAAKIRHKQLRDPRSRAAVLGVGDRVLVRKLAFTGKHKLADRWESDIYVVVEKPNPDIPVYIVQAESRTGGGRRCRRTLHRNHLLPVGELLSLDTVSDPVVDTAEMEEKEVVSESTDSLESDSDDDDARMDRPAAAAETAQEQTTNAQAEAQESSSENSEDEHDEVGNEVEGPDPSNSVDSDTDTADEVAEEAPERRYPLRHRRPPDRYQAMNQSSKKLDIVHDLVKLLNNS